MSERVKLGTIISNHNFMALLSWVCSVTLRGSECIMNGKDLHFQNISAGQKGHETPPVKKDFHFIVMDYSEYFMTPLDECVFQFLAILASSTCTTLSSNQK